MDEIDISNCILIDPLNQSAFSGNKNLSDVIEIEEIIPIHGLGEEEIISKVDKVQYYDGRYYILDSKFSNLLTVDSTGGFLQKIGRIGGGPGEYLGINDFNLSSDGKEIVIFSNSNMALFYYSIQGNYTKRAALPFYSSKFFQLDSANLGFYVDFNRHKEAFNLFITDGVFNIKRRYFPFTDLEYTGFQFTGGFGLGSINHEPLLSVALSDTIYSISDKKVKAKYAFNFGQKKISTEQRMDHKKFMSAAIDLSFLQNMFVESPNHLIYDFQDNQKANIGIYFKHSKTSYFFNRTSSTDFLEKNNLAAIRAEK